MTALVDTICYTLIALSIAVGMYLEPMHMLYICVKILYKMLPITMACLLSIVFALAEYSIGYMSFVCLGWAVYVFARNNTMVSILMLTATSFCDWRDSTTYTIPFIVGSVLVRAYVYLASTKPARALAIGDLLPGFIPMTDP